MPPLLLFLSYIDIRMSIYHSLVLDLATVGHDPILELPNHCGGRGRIIPIPQLSKSHFSFGSIKGRQETKLGSRKHSNTVVILVGALVEDAWQEEINDG
jgi:hypothetical protein